MYERGEYPATPNGISSKQFKANIRIWKRMVDSSGIGAFHRNKLKKHGIIQSLSRKGNCSATTINNFLKISCKFWNFKMFETI